MLKQCRMLLIALSLVLPALAAAATPADVVETIVSGVGTDIERAKYNAARNAIESVIGTFISAESIVKNDRLIKDELLSHSAGYINTMDIISTERSNDGLIHVKAKASVVRSKLRSQVQALRLTDRSVKGEHLFAEVQSKIDLQKRNSSLVDLFMRGYPEAAYNHSLYAPVIINTNPSTGNAQVKVQVDVAWQSRYVQNFKQLAAQVTSVNRDNLINVCFRTSHGRSECHKIDQALIQDTHFGQMFKPSKLLLLLKDKAGVIVHRQYIERRRLPNLHHDKYSQNSQARYLEIDADGVTKESFEFSLPAEKLRFITSIQTQTILGDWPR